MFSEDSPPIRRARRSSKRARHMASEWRAAPLGWLSGHVLWRDGHAVWQHAHGELRPGAADLSAAQRALHKLSARTLGEADAAGVFRTGGDAALWERLDLAKRLRGLEAPDLTLLASPSRARNPAAARRLVELLVAEATCLNEMPLRPSEVLAGPSSSARFATGGEVAAVITDALCGLVRDESLWPGARALAALVLGASGRVNAELTGALAALSEATFDSPRHGGWLRRAWQWGLRRGLPAHPALTVEFLAHEQGVRHANECGQSLARFEALDFPPQLVREALHTGANAEEAAAIVRAALSFEATALDLARWTRSLMEQKLPDEASSESRKKRRRRLQARLGEPPAPIAPSLRQEVALARDEALAQLRDLLHGFVRATPDAAAVEKAAQAVRFFLAPLFETAPDAWPHLLEAGPRVGLDAIFKGALRPLQAVSELPAPLQKPFVDLLLLCQGGHWDRTEPLRCGAKGGHGGHGRLGAVGAWHRSLWDRDVGPLHALVGRCGDVALAREALEAELHEELSGHEWRDPETYRVFLMLARGFGHEWTSWDRWLLGSALNHFSSGAAARAAFAPVVAAFRDASPTARHALFFAVLDAADDACLSLRTVLPRLAPHAHGLRRFAEKAPERNNCAFAITAVVQLDQELQRHFESRFESRGETPEATGEASQVLVALPTSTCAEGASVERGEHEQRVQAWLSWLLSHLLESQSRSKDAVFYNSNTPVVRLAAVLAHGDMGLFQSVLPAAIRYDWVQETAHVEQGLRALSAFPRLRGAMALLFARQPRRCADLLERLGLSARLGAEVLAPLQALEEHEEPFALSSDAAWNALNEAAPDLSELAASFRRARRALGQPDGAPPGVVRALEERRRRTLEMAHLERKLESEPDRADLAARAASLRERLSDGEAWQNLLREQAGERLRQAAAEANLELGEQQVRACYQSRLQQLAGTLPPDAEFDVHWYNAALLSMDIRSNRRLLRRLLRAQVAGEQSWRQQHPANALFLRGARSRGINVEAWLSTRPRAFVGAALGGRLRLHMERDPLRILQMGNLFDTCLSFGGCNSFSTVANACELNKRVIYATDPTGRTVGRQLIAINAQGELVGFRVYTSLSDSRANRAVRAIFRRYALAFAHDCNLALATSGPVPTLFADEWYDDGIRFWDDEEHEDSGSTPRASKNTPVKLRQ